MWARDKFTAPDTPYSLPTTREWKELSKKTMREYFASNPDAAARWHDFIFIEHSDKSDDLCDVYMQVLSLVYRQQNNMKLYGQKMIEAVFAEKKTKKEGKGTGKGRGKRKAEEEGEGEQKAEEQKEEGDERPVSPSPLPPPPSQTRTKRTKKGPPKMTINLLDLEDKGGREEEESHSLLLPLTV